MYIEFALDHVFERDEPATSTVVVKGHRKLKFDQYLIDAQVQYFTNVVCFGALLIYCLRSLMTQGRFRCGATTRMETFMLVLVGARLKVGILLIYLYVSSHYHYTQAWSDQGR